MMRFSLLAVLSMGGLVLVGCDGKETDDGNGNQQQGNPGGGGGGGDDTGIDGPGGGGPGGGPGADDTGTTGGPGGGPGSGPGTDDTGTTGGPGGGPGGGTDDTGTTGGPGGSPGGGPGGDEDYSINDVQTGGVAAGTIITLEGVIATSGIDSDGDGFYIQDLGGGEWSGLYVYIEDKSAASLTIDIGKSYSVTGEIKEYYGLTEISVATASDISAEGGPAVTPTVDSVNPATISDWEKWEGCLVSLGDVSVDSVDAYGQALVDGDILIDNSFYDHGLSEGDEIGEAIGVVHYEFELWRLYPRSSADLIDVTDGGDTGGPGGPGGGPGGGGTGTDVSDIQTGAVSEGDIVTIENVIATTGFSYSGDGFFVQDSGGGAYSGLYIYLAGGKGLLDIETGDELTITGEVKEYYDLTELYVSAPSDVTETGTGSVTTNSVDPATVSDWEEWEGCLIEVGGAVATSATDKYGQTELNNGLLMDDELYDYTFGVSIGTSWSNIRGVLNYTYSQWVIYPRDATDL